MSYRSDETLRYAELVHKARHVASCLEQSDKQRQPLGDLQTTHQHASERTLLAATRACHELLQQRCEVSITYQEEWYSTYSDEIWSLVQLANWFRDLAERERAAGRFDSMAALGIDILRLASVIRCSGLFTGLAFSLGVEIAGLRLLAASCDASARNPQQIMLALREHERARESFCSIVSRDCAWERAVGVVRAPEQVVVTCCGIHRTCSHSTDKDRSCVARLSPPSSTPARSVDSGRSRGIHCMHCTDMLWMGFGRLLQTDLDIRTRTLSEGSVPQALAASAVLDASALVDPFSEEIWRYRVDARGRYVLYGCDPTGRDHGGLCGSITDILDCKADVCLDTVLRD
jgi:hypothetical protein